MRLPLALLLAVLPTSVAFADDRPAADLVAAIVIGAGDGATWSFLGQISGVLKETAPGTFEAPAANGGPAVLFTVTERSKCVFDIVFSLDKQVQGGLELDANKLKSVTYSGAAPQAGGWTDYSIDLDGADGVVQSLHEDGTLSETSNTSTLSTSIPQSDLEADVIALQSSFCPAAA
ncbi:MAG: hypothetical protein ABI398_13095 [Devosia sp.]